MFSGIGFCILILLVCVYLDSQRAGSQRSRVSRADDRELERHIRRLDRQERLSALYKAYQTPWPWWFFGSCLAFAVLVLIAGITSWPATDAFALVIGGTLFLLAFLFKAFAQEQGRLVRLRVRLKRR
jgi:Flp pilus assembly protein TadB